MKRKTSRVVTIGVAFCVIILLLYTAVITFETSRIERHASHIASVERKITKESHPVDDAFFPGERSLREAEGWGPDDFFNSPETLHACEAISAREYDRLKEMIASGLDVNLSGKEGVTLLHWAFFCGNLDAFKLLLQSGADPDKRLADSITRLSTQLAPRDSMVFTCMRQMRWQFFFAALSYTRNVNQLDGGGSTLLHVAMWNPTIFSVSPKTLQRLIDSGIDLDAQDKYGNTAALNAISWERPLLCLQLLKSGADPGARNNDGYNIADKLSKKVASYQRRGNAIRPDGLDQLQEWLEAHGRQQLEQP